MQSDLAIHTTCVMLQSCLLQAGDGGDDKAADANSASETSAEKVHAFAFVGCVFWVLRLTIRLLTYARIAAPEAPPSWTPQRRMQGRAL